MKSKTIWNWNQLASSHMTLLRTIALIPFKNEKLNSYKTVLLSFYHHLGITMYTASYVGYAIKMTKSETFDISFICEFLMVLNIHIRYVLLYFKRKKLMLLFDMCKELWSFINPEESHIIRLYERKAFYFRQFLATNAALCAIMYVVNVQFTNIQQRTENNTTLRVLPFKFFIDDLDNPEYTIVSIIQCILVIIQIFAISGIETIGLFLIMMACGYLKVLEKRLLSLTKLEKNITMTENTYNENDSYVSLVNNLKLSIKYHQQIILFCENIEKFMRPIYFWTILTSVYNMSITGLKIIEQNSDMGNYIFLLMVNLVSCFNCQWSPEYLIIRSEAIKNAVYFSISGKFYHFKKINTMLYFMMLRAQKPLLMTAGGFIRLSIENFGNMVKNAFSLFALLRRVNN